MPGQYFFSNHFVLFFKGKFLGDLLESHVLSHIVFRDSLDPVARL